MHAMNYRQDGSESMYIGKLFLQAFGSFFNFRLVDKHEGNIPLPHATEQCCQMVCYVS